MGQGVTFIAQVSDEEGNLLEDAGVEITVYDPAGKTIARLPAVVGGASAYRTARWEIPHRQQEGEWSFEVRAQTNGREAARQSAFQVINSTSEYLLENYGFWLDAPRLKNIVPTLMAEQGNAENGLIRWGGQLIAIHILPANWVEVHWRSGEFPLESEDDARRFLEDKVGDLGFTPVREIGPFQRTKFKGWDAWEVAARGQYIQDQVEYLVFYSPEVNKTFAIGTTVVVPPSGIDPHAALRASFEVDPAIQPNGVEKEPLPDLLPKVKLLDPPMGEVFVGQGKPVVVSWEPLKELAEDEYYEVLVDYNYIESNVNVRYATRETSFTLPVDLQDQPNCQVFNWQVRLMRQIGSDANGQPRGEPLSYRSFYRYLIWRYPDDAPPPFDIICRNAQF